MPIVGMVMDPYFLPVVWQVAVDAALFGVALGARLFPRDLGLSRACRGRRGSGDDGG
jgi:hypothetical protein